MVRVAIVVLLAMRFEPYAPRLGGVQGWIGPARQKRWMVGAASRDLLVEQLISCKKGVE
jgi:hypothetical protein